MVCREYFRRPQANAASFTDGWFHSGDVGRFDDEQFLYIVDRVKDMIISGGLNVYSREVEQAIESFDAVREVAVVGRPDPEFGESVVAFVALRPERSLTEDEIIARCRERLASYKKPKQVYFFDSLPRNASGKVLKSTLREQLTD
jgi:acyl-CoA synthetase (AMP-forming)/AMP-acid ligase II